MVRAILSFLSSNKKKPYPKAPAKCFLSSGGFFFCGLRQKRASITQCSAMALLHPSSPTPLADESENPTKPGEQQRIMFMVERSIILTPPTPIWVVL
jgi:hypothetical protein